MWRVGVVQVRRGCVPIGWGSWQCPAYFVTNVAAASSSAAATADCFSDEPSRTVNTHQNRTLLYLDLAFRFDCFIIFIWPTFLTGDWKRGNGKRGTAWKTRDQIAWVENAGPENGGPNFTGVEKSGPPTMEREMDKSKCRPIMYR